MSPYRRTALVLCLVMVLGFAPTLQAQGAALPLDLFRYDRSALLSVTDSLLRVTDGVEVRAISFSSPKGGRVTGRLFLPAGPGPFAGVIVQHGAPARVDSGLIRLLDDNVVDNAMAIAKAGGVVLAIHAPWARRLAPPVTLTPQDSVDQVQMIVDLQRAVDVLLARKDVDPKRLAYVGRSWGGAIGGLFGGVERRLATYVLQVGDGGLVSHFTAPESPPGPPPGVPREQWERWLAAMRPVEPIRFAGRIAPASVLLQSGRRDQAVPPALATRLHDAVSEPKRVIWYDAGHGLDDSARRDLLEWLREKIGIRGPG